MSNYNKKYYSMSVKEANDEVCVNKSTGADWCTIKMVNNDEFTGDITIRSREMAEQLKFMLGQMLDKE